MIFTTPWFVVFATISVALFWLVPKGQIRLLYLATMCAVFHTHFAGPAGVAPIVVMILATYGAAMTRKEGLIVGAMIFNVLALVFYKYVNFVLGAGVAPWFPELAKLLDGKVEAVMPGAPPLAISFFTFEFVHYLFEVKRGGEPVRNPIKFLLFAIFFPSLVAGPIKRYTQFIPEVEEAARRMPKWEDFSEGFRRIGLGVAKKVLVADQLTYWIDQVHPALEQEGLMTRWAFLVAVGIRILFDFSGYTDIAIGCSRLIGVRLPENFNWPYLATNIQEFWQRWHISLSSWIRDYIYIPLGGNRVSWMRRVMNGVVAFALCGLWHGPAWNFVAWGLYHGLGLAVCLVYPRIPGLAKGAEWLFTKEPLVKLFLTQLFVFLGWLLFFYPIPEALRLAKLLFGLS
ncbi:MAG: MBOAT family O-acyltransferase [Opitutaceae bacterium]|nr:MBOAT family O-acyltransferase [Opitutaceae bacterium]